MLRGTGLLEQHAALLRETPLFAGLDTVALAKLVARLEVLQLEDGESVVQHGEAADALYIISRGRVGVFSHNRNRLRTCGPGELIGEIGLVTGEARSATVRADGEAEILRLPREQFDDLVRRDPSVPLSLAATLGTRLRTAGQPSAAAAPVVATAPLAAAPRARVSTRLLSANQAIGLALAALVLTYAWLIAPPIGFTEQGWHAAATLLAVVPLLVLDALPDGVVALMLVAAWVLGGVASPRVALSGFGSSTWMLTIAVLLIGSVIGSSGLLFRLALWAMAHARGDFRFEAAVLCLTGWLTSAAVPSPSNRMLLAAPAVTDVVEACGYAPGSRAAAGLAMAALLGFGQTVAPFLTSSTTALLTLSVLPDATRASVDWGTWAVRAAPTYAVLLVGMLVIIIWRYAPRTASARRTDVLAVQRALLGPISRQERVTGIVTLLLVACFASQPVHHIDPAWIALAAVGVLATVGFVTPETLRSVNWNLALLLGTLASIVGVFTATGLDRSLSDLVADALGRVSAGPLVFACLLTLICFAVSFVLRLMAAAPLITVAVAPVAAGLGIDPWVVAIIALIGTSVFFLPYQSTSYQSIHQALDGRLFQHDQVRTVAIAYGALALLAIVLSVPVWHAMGLL